MEEPRIEPVANFSKEALDHAKEEAALEIHRFTVALWTARRDRGSGKLVAQAIGSGTLVAAGDFCGVLTADHVAQRWNKDEPLVLNISNRDHQFFIEPSFIEYLVVGEFDKRRPEDEGPDLAILRITDLAKLGTLRSKKIFLRLDKHSADEVKARPLEAMQWWIAGAPEEKNLPASGDENPGQTLFHAEADFLRIEERGNFDYLTTNTLAGTGEFPGSYGGVSGGGIWQFMFTVEDEAHRDKIGYTSPILSGVAFCEGAPTEGKIDIIGHGPKSIYESAREVLQRPATP